MGSRTEINMNSTGFCEKGFDGEYYGYVDDDDGNEILWVRR